MNKTDLRYSFYKIKTYLMSEQCLCCGGILENGNTALCDKCKSKLLDKAGKTGFAGNFPLIVTWEYGDEIRPVIHNLKYRSDKGAGLMIAEGMAKAIRANAVSFDCVMGVPRHKKSSRRFCQAEFLADCIADFFGKESVKGVLVKKKNIKSQTECHDREERKKNVKGAYVSAKDCDVSGKKFLLVDDVVTTGATLEECAAALTAAGASVVCCAAVRPNAEKQTLPIQLGSGYYAFSEKNDLPRRSSDEIKKQ